MSKDYICPQCGPDPNGADAHAEKYHMLPKDTPLDEDLCCDNCHAKAKEGDKNCWNCGSTTFVYEPSNVKSDLSPPLDAVPNMDGDDSGISPIVEELLKLLLNTVFAEATTKKQEQGLINNLHLVKQTERRIKEMLTPIKNHQVHNQFTPGGDDLTAVDLAIAEYNLGPQLLKVYKPDDLRVLLSDSRAVKLKETLMQLLEASKQKAVEFAKWNVVFMQTSQLRTDMMPLMVHSKAEGFPSMTKEILDEIWKKAGKEFEESYAQLKSLEEEPTTNGQLNRGAK